MRQDDSSWGMFNDSTEIDVRLKEGSWRVCSLSNGLWRLDNKDTGMIVLFDGILISGGCVQFFRGVDNDGTISYHRDGEMTASFVDEDVFPASIADWIREVEHTGRIAPPTESERDEPEAEA